MKTKILILATLLIMFIGVNAQPARNIRMVRMINVMHSDSVRVNKQKQMMRQNRFRTGLDLTEEQMKAFKDIRLQMHKEIKPFQNQLGEAVAHQKTLVSADDPKLNAINDNIEKIGEIKTEMAKIRTKYLLEMRSKLTDEQRMRLEMRRSHQKNFGRPGMHKGFNGPEFGGSAFHKGQMGLDFRGPGEEMNF